MNEERIKAYLKLINALLYCSSDEESAILNSNQNLIDTDLVQLMAQLSIREAEEGEHRLANKLRNLASQLVIEIETEANRLLNQGVEQFESSQLEAAFQSWQQALTIYRDLGHRLGEAKTIGHLGLIFYSIGQYQEALNHHQQHLEIAQEISDRLQEAKSLGNLGNTYHCLGQYKKAIEYHQQCLDIMQEIGDAQGEAIALSGLGNSFYSLGQYHQAIDHYQQCLDIIQEIGDRRVEAASLSGLGNAYRSQGQYQQAIKHHQQCLAIMREIGDRQGEAAALSGLGNAFDSLGQYEQAIEYHEQQLAIAQNIGDRSQEGTSLGNLGNAYLQIGQYQKAIESSQYSLKIAREICDYQGEATSLSSLGNAYHLLGQYEQAIEYHQHSLNIDRKIGNLSGEGKCLNNLGNVLDSWGQYQQAIESYQQSLKIAQAIGDPQHEATSLNNLGNASYSLRQYQQAIEYYQQALDILRKIGDRNGEATPLANLGNAFYCQRQYQQGIESHKLSLNIARQLGDLRLKGLSLSNLGAALLKSGKFAEADSLLREGIQVWESIRVGLEDDHKVSIFEEQAHSYHLLQEVLIVRNRSREALEIAERGRARAFVELLTKRLFRQAAEQSAVTPPNIQRIQQIAQEQKSTIVEYSILYSEILLIWLIEPTGKIAFRQVDLKPLKQQNTSLSDLVSQARESLEVPEKRRDAPRLLQQLHEILIQPIANLLPDNPEDSVIFIPQQSLFLVPFPALLDSKTNQFLIEKHTILTAPSIQVLDSTHKQQQLLKDEWTSKKDEKISDFYLVVGNPIMPSIAPEIGQPPEQLPQLEGAESQAKTIAKLLNTQPIIRDDATKLNIVQRMSSARLIHLATHGLLDDIRELGVPGAIALAPTEGIDNGFLTAGEILELKLKAELVVLSACLTGLGKITGDGVIGLSRCLFLAGVPSVIVSLWSVPDEPTQYLMTEFYSNLQSGMNKAKALRQAILKTKQKFRSPVNWAGFTLIGEAE